MKTLFFVLAVFVVLKTNAQDYLINFAGVNTPINIVQVENLTTGEILSLRGSDILHLTNVITGINDIDKTIVGMKIYPNPAINNSTTIKFNVPAPGDATISIYNIKGEKIIQIHDYLSNSLQEYQLYNINEGFYLVEVRNVNYHLTGKIICSGASNGTMIIEKLSNNQSVQYRNISMEKQTSVTRSLEVDGTVNMLYMPGNMLKFTAISGNDRTTLTDVPDKTKTITFDIIPVSDKDSNNYHIVEIGDQAWLEENMKTTKYRDGLSIPLVTDNAQWSALNSDAYSWYDNNKATAKDPYGALYNGFVVGTGKICPLGWHVASLDEWNALRDYLLFNNYSYSKDIPGSIAKSLASKTLWNVPQPKDMGHGAVTYPSPAAVGLNPLTNNNTGFNAFPGGLRGFDGRYSGKGDMAIFGTNWGASSVAYSSLIYQSVGVDQGYAERQVGFSVRCVKGEVKTFPTIYTPNNLHNITQTTAVAETSIQGVGESPITGKGVCWCVFDNARTDFPTINDFKTADGSGTAPFTSYLTGLKPGTLYYIRGYTINGEGVSYGNIQTFTTDIADVDGNIYNTILLYDMIWTTENLKTTKLNDNTAIPLLSQEWASTAPGYCYYNNDTALLGTYGALYNWYTVNTNKLCPKDYHVASNDDWTSLTKFLSGDNTAGGRLKEEGTVHWLSPNTGAGSNSSSFDDGNDVHFEALPGGMRLTDATFINITKSGMWWTATQFDTLDAWSRQINYDAGNIVVSNSNIADGLSVRCVKKPF